MPKTKAQLIFQKETAEYIARTAYNYQPNNLDPVTQQTALEAATIILDNYRSVILAEVSEKVMKALKD